MLIFMYVFFIIENVFNFILLLVKVIYFIVRDFRKYVFDNELMDKSLK